MTSEILLEAIGNINDGYILSAGARLGYAPLNTYKPIVKKSRRPTRKAIIGIAATIILLLGSFVTAMAVSETFREFIFSIFNIESPEKIPSPEDDLDFDGTIGQIGNENIDDAVSVYYFKIDGILRAYNGIVYSSEYDGDGAAFYNVTSDGLEEIEATRTEFAYNFMGTDFNIKFDYTVYNDTLFFRELQESMDVNPYKYGWSMQNASNSVDTVWLVLPYIVNVAGSERYSSYPFLYNVRTNEITDVFEGVDIASIAIDRWQFTDDMAYALIWGQSEEDAYGFWTCDIAQKTITNVGELIGGTINDCYILKDNIIVCYVASGEKFDVINYNISTGAQITIIENVQHYYKTDDGSGLRSIEYYGKQGQHALYFGSSGEVTLLDLMTGEHLELTGLKNDGTIITAESPDGEHILIAFKDSGVSNSLALYTIGVLDMQTGVLSMLEREGYEAKTEHSIEWFDDARIVVIASNANDEFYMYIYEFN